MRRISSTSLFYTSVGYLCCSKHRTCPWQQNSANTYNVIPKKMDFSFTNLVRFDWLCTILWYQHTFCLYLKLYRYKINTNSQYTSSKVISYRSMILTIRRIGGMGAVQGNIFFKNQRKVEINIRKLLFCLCRSPAIGLDCYEFSPVCENVSTFLK